MIGDIKISYTYYNGVFQVTTEIKPKFKRYHSCNAQYHISVFNGKDHGMNEKVDSKTYTLISYDTWIIHCSWNRNGWILYVNPNAYEYSVTTTRQLNRFITEYHIPITMNDIKEAINISVKENTNIVWCDDIIIRFMSSSEICDMWNRIFS